MDGLSDFFKLIKEEKKKQDKELHSLLGEDFSTDKFIEDIFSTAKKEVKKEKIIKEKIENIFDKIVLEEILPIKEELKPTEEIEEETQEEILEEVSEGLLNITPDVKNSDPLTPLDQNFATLDDLQKHYSLFLNRIQQQLSTLGGGGEYRFRYLDGLVGIKTNPGAYDGKFLQWNSSKNEAEFVNPNSVGITSIISISGVTTYYQASNVDDYIGVNANVPVTIVLPQIPSYGKKLIVKDEGNKIATYNITVQAGAGTSVENDTSVLMKINHQSFTYFYNGSNWFLI